MVSHSQSTPEANVAYAPHVASTDSYWFPDSGGTNNLTNVHPQPQVTTPYLESNKVLVGNGFSLHISATGSSLILTNNRNLQLSDMLYTPSVTKNLLYVPQFSKDNNVFLELYVDQCLVKD